MNKNSIIEELNEIAPLLSKLRKPPQEQLGGVPEGYFGDFEQKLLEKIQSEEPGLLLANLKKPGINLLGDVPQDYFSNFESRLNEKIASIEEELETPILDSLKKPANEQLGALPEGYFDQLEEAIAAKVENKAKLLQVETPPKVRSLRPVYVMGIAASILLMIVSTVWLVRGGKTSSPFAYELMANMNVDEGINNMQLAEASAYLMENLDAMDTEDILESLNEESIQALSQTNLMADSLPPVKDPKTENPNELNNDNKNITPNPTLKPQEGGLVEELEDEVAEETDLDELFGKISDSDLDALEAALLKPKEPKKKETPKEKK